MSTPYEETPRWTLPPRTQISPDNIHISSFIIAKKGRPGDPNYSLLLLRAGNNHRISFKRGKLLLPAATLTYGEKPREGARRVLRDQLQDPSLLRDLEFTSMQSYLGDHWDIVFLFETWVKDDAQSMPTKEPFVQAAFYPINALPRAEIAEDHLEVIEEMLHPTDATG